MDSADEETTYSSDLLHSPPTPSKRKAQKTPQQKAKRVKYASIAEEQPKKGKNKNDLLSKAPTIEELNDLKMTENLYNNNLFRLQIEELIKEVTIKTKRKKALSAWLQSFKESINNMPEFEDILLSDITTKSKRGTFIHRLATKYSCNYETDQNLSLKWLKPSNFNFFGLYENKSLAGPSLEASINIQFPKSCFHVKDFLNNRYLVKRFYYLAYIAENIPAHKVSVIKLHENNILLPVLQVQPTEDSKLSINIYVTPSEGCFKPSRFFPNQNNIKQDLFGDDIGDIAVLKGAPTVLYNSALGHDATLSVNSDFVKVTLEDNANVQEGIKLLGVWLKQRELDFGYGAVTSHLVMYLVVYLLSKKTLNKFMSSYQVVRNFWAFVASTDLENHPISLGDCLLDTLQLFKKHFSLVFLDKTGCYNLTAFVSLSRFRKFRMECQLAMKHLNDNKMESFHYLFLTKLPFALQYDLLLDVTEALPLEGHFACTDLDKATNIGYARHFLSISKLSELLQKGLNKRALNIVPHIQVQYDPSSPIKRLIYGINLNHETAFNFIELGPSLNDFAAASEFRQFWGHLSSDRRFRDGSTNVAVYFKTSTVRGKRGIIKRIIKYLLTEKLTLRFKLFYDEFEELLVNKKVQSPYPVGSNEESSLKIVNLADELGQKLRNVQMSLSVTGIQGISDAFSFSELFPPIASKFKPAEHTTEVKGKKVIFANKKIGMVPKYVEPLELVLQLEHSSKWPNNLDAIRHIKTSFYLELAKMLEDSHGIICNVNREYLEVFFQGLVFRYRLYVPKEVAVIKRAITESGSKQYTENIASEDYERTLNVLPKVNAALKGLQQQYPSFGPGTALIKRWLRSHLIDDFHLPDIVVNLLNASLYVNSTCFEQSCTPQMSFLRFLKFMSEFQWQLQPLLVNFNEEISKEDVVAFESKFQQNLDGVQPLYVITPYDQGRSVFSKHAPSKEILHRVQQLAMAALTLAVSRIVDQNAFDVKELFKPNMEGYDLLIHLRPLLNARRHEQLDNEGDSKIVLEKYEHHKSEKIPITGFNPVDLYLRTLRDNYGDFATFFHDSYGGNTVAVLWNPKAREVKEFKVSYASGRRLEGNKLVLNEDAIIGDFYNLGKGVVKWIEKK